MIAVRTILSVIALLGLSYGAALAAGDQQKCDVPNEEQAARGCICMLPTTSTTTDGVVLLDDIRGDVLKSLPIGFVPVSKPTWLNVGDTVLVKTASKATLVAGANCTREIGPNVSVVINPIDDGCACAVLAQQEAAVEKPAGSLHHALLVAGLGGAAAAVGILHFSKPVSP